MMWGWSFLERPWQDVRYALRGMWRNPGFTTVAVLSLALGAGANTAIFSLINTLMLRLLPVREPGQLVELMIQYPGEPAGSSFSARSYEYYRDHNHVFSAVSGIHTDRFRIRGGGTAQSVAIAECVAGNFFPMLGVRPAIGRLVGPEDDREGQADSAVVVLSWSSWKTRFHLDPAVLGKRLLVEDVPVTIIGVTPPEFTGMRVGTPTDVWLTLAAERMIEPQRKRGLGDLALLARLKPGVSLERARTEMAVLFRFTLEERIRGSQDSLLRQLKFTVEPAGTGLYTEVRDQFGRPLVALMAAVTLLLAIACTNVGSMMLARGAARRREMALRVSLGASRLRVVRQVLTESLLLSMLGCLVGMFFAWWGTSALAAIVRSGRFIEGRPEIDVSVLPDGHVLAFTVGIAVAAAILFGLAPAWAAFSASPGASLRESRGRGETRLGRVFGRGLVVAQVALSVGLLSAAGLFVGRLSNLKNADLGFQRDRVLLVKLDAGDDRAQRPLSGDEVLERLGAIPGVRSATIMVGSGPLSGAGESRFVHVEGHTERPEERRYVAVSRVGPRYFETLGTPLLAGRDFRFDDRGRARVAIVNEAMARSYFGERNPIGRYLTLDGEPEPYEIAGVVGNAKYYDIREAPLRTVYLNALQFPEPASNFAVRTFEEPDRVVSGVRSALGEHLSRVTMLADQVDATIVPERLAAMLSGCFGVLGALLAAIGLYGLLAYTVARRVSEIGIRMAMGATRGAVAWMVVREALGWTCAGLAIGVPVAYGVTGGGVVPTAIGCVVMAGLAMAAAYVPARRAARVDPMVALRCE